MKGHALLLVMFACDQGPKTGAKPPPAGEVKVAQPAKKAMKRSGSAPVAEKILRSEPDIASQDGVWRNPFHEEIEPEFLKRGSGLHREGGRPWFIALGKVPFTGDRKAAHMGADVAAQAQMLKLLKTFNKKAHPTDPAKLDALAEEWASNHARIVDHWLDHDTNEWYSKKRVPALGYAAELGKVEGVDPAAVNKLLPPRPI